MADRHTETDDDSVDFVGKDGSGRDVRFKRYDGLNYPVGVTKLMETGGFSRQLRTCRDMEVKDTDVFIAAFVKSGMHWLWEVTHMLMNNTNEYSSEPKENSMLDFRSAEHVFGLQEPRLLNLHFPLKYFPKQAIQKRRPIIHIMRNPKDVFVSYYNHYTHLKMAYEPIDSFSNFLPMMTGENGFNLKQPWYEYETEWERFGQENLSYPILYLYYEDLKEDLEKWVWKIAEFLKLNPSKDLVHEIAAKNEISVVREGLKERRPNDKLQAVKTADGNPIMYRKGAVGDWKNWFTVADNEKMDAWLEKNFKDTNLKFRYSL